MVAAQRPTGFTLIELVTVVAVVSLLTVAAAPSFSDLVANHRTKNAATDLYVALAKARSEAVKRNASVTVSPNAGVDWQSGWKIVDTNVVPNVVLDTRGAVAGAAIAGGPASVVYQSSGRIQGNAGVVFTITGAAASAPKRCVTASLSGRPYVKPC
jgi:type IV fimbrial biogenesis protein FimT